MKKNRAEKLPEVVSRSHLLGDLLPIPQHYFEGELASHLPSLVHEVVAHHNQGEVCCKNTHIVQHSSCSDYSAATNWSEL